MPGLWHQVKFDPQISIELTRNSENTMFRVSVPSCIDSIDWRKAAAAATPNTVAQWSLVVNWWRNASKSFGQPYLRREDIRRLPINLWRHSKQPIASPPPRPKYITTLYTAVSTSGVPKAYARLDRTQGSLVKQPRPLSWDRSVYLSKSNSNFDMLMPAM